MQNHAASVCILSGKVERLSSLRKTVLLFCCILFDKEESSSTNNSWISNRFDDMKDL